MNNSSLQRHASDFRDKINYHQPKLLPNCHGNCQLLFNSDLQKHKHLCLFKTLLKIQMDLQCLETFPDNQIKQIWSAQVHIWGQNILWIHYIYPSWFPQLHSDFTLPIGLHGADFPNHLSPDKCQIYHQVQSHHLKFSALIMLQHWQFWVGHFPQQFLYSCFSSSVFLSTDFPYFPLMLTSPENFHFMIWCYLYDEDSSKFYF